jgi:hypothetical protein
MDGEGGTRARTCSDAQLGRCDRSIALSGGAVVLQPRRTIPEYGLVLLTGAASGMGVVLREAVQLL